MPKSRKTPRTWTIGLAVSGGADSTALLAALADLRDALDFDAVVLHVDHGLRPDSHDDARFVEALAARFGLPCRTLRARIRRRPRESLEMAARRTRLAFFARMTRELGLDAIATGHHADDVAETFIMRMARGAGPEGLAGLKPVSHVDGITFIRPLLDVRDAELKDFLRRRGMDWREDASNADISILRNKVRHIVLPWLKENLDRRLTEHICKTAAILRGDLTRPAEKPAEKTTPQRAASSFILRIEPGTGFERTPQSIGKTPATACLSRHALAGRTLELRPWRAGDRIAPTGMGGRSRKLQDVFVTAKVPQHIRRSLPVLADAETGEILWLPGYRIAQSAAVESVDSPSWRLTLRKDGP